MDQTQDIAPRVKKYLSTTLPVEPLVDVLAIKSTNSRHIIAHVNIYGIWVDQDNKPVEISWWTWLPESGSVYEPRTRKTTERKELSYIPKEKVDGT